MSRPVVLSPYRPEWAGEFLTVGHRIRTIVGALAIRIDHIGSTAVPALAAKDVIDIQITVESLEACATMIGALREAGFRRGDTWVYDEFHGMANTDRQLQKLYMREPEGTKRTHIHIREYGRFNQRYALLFRDYLRACEPVRREYELLKYRAAEAYPKDIDGYLRLKEPVFHLIYEAAAYWANQTGWTPESDGL